MYQLRHRWGDRPPHRCPHGTIVLDQRSPLLVRRRTPMLPPRGVERIVGKKKVMVVLLRRSGRPHRPATTTSKRRQRRSAPHHRVVPRPPHTIIDIAAGPTPSPPPPPPLKAAAATLTAAAMRSGIAEGGIATVTATRTRMATVMGAVWWC